MFSVFSSRVAEQDNNAHHIATYWNGIVRFMTHSTHYRSFLEQPGPIPPGSAQ